ncbi:MAG: hypothetical protein LBJ64_11180, partial [Deltaproteobacteria bacterium]|nr:hypothetical protein [Deltaproteobacteria bacterium]
KGSARVNEKTTVQSHKSRRFLKNRKTALHGESPLGSQTPELVRQEIWGFPITHFAVRQLIHEAALKRQKDPDGMSFKSSVCEIERVLPLAAGAPPDQMKAWMDGLPK